MAQESMLDDVRTPTLLIEVHDHTLLSLSDATEVVVRHQDLRGDIRFVATTTLVGVQQDLLETLLSRVLVASRYGTDADVRMTMVKTAKEARAHAKAHERE